MSITTTTIDAHGVTETVRSGKGPSIWRRALNALVAARHEQAKRELAFYINSLSDQQRKDLGFPPKGGAR